MRAVLTFFAASCLCLAALSMFINLTLAPDDDDEHLFDLKTRKEWSIPQVAERVRVFGWGAFWMGAGFIIAIGAIVDGEDRQRQKDREALNKEKQKTD